MRASLLGLLRPCSRTTSALPQRTVLINHRIAMVTPSSTVRATPSSHPFTTSAPRPATYMQVARKCRKPQPARKKRSPAVAFRSEMKGVCLKVMVTKPKKPNSGERKTCRVRLSSGAVVNAYIPGEGHNVQQHSVVLLKGGRKQDCPGVRYRCVRGAGDLGGVPNRITSRSKYGTKKPKTN